MRWRLALATACGTVVSPAAHAHGGAVPPWVPALLVIAFAGIVACIFVPLLVGRGSMWKRAAIGLAWAGVDLLAWWALMYLGVRANTVHAPLPLPEALGHVMIGFLALFTWILPLVLFIVGRRTGR